MSQRQQAWMRQAKSDFEVGELTQSQGFHSQACYHYSQAAEKALKGLLISMGTLPPYSHSLDRIAEAIREQGVDTAWIDSLHLKALSRMNSETRYPRDDEAPIDRFDANDSGMAQEAAKAVLRFVESALMDAS